MANRKLPFGYEMRRGTVCVNAAEACVVKKIYAAYTGGMSYRQITDHLNTQPIPYSEQRTLWNKNMIARILDCELYTGKDSYPSIISAVEWHQAKAVKPATGSPSEASRRIKAVRQIARCAACGSTLTLSANKYGWARWNCPACETISADAAAPDTVAALSGILAAIGHAHDMVQIPPESDSAMQIVSKQLQTEFDEAIRSDEFDETAARLKAFSLAAARFDILGSEDYETMRIQYILAGAEQSDGLDIKLLRQITSAILIHPSGAVSLKLKNGQIIERSDIT